MSQSALYVLPCHIFCVSHHLCLPHNCNSIIALLTSLPWTYFLFPCWTGTIQILHSYLMSHATCNTKKKENNTTTPRLFLQLSNIVLNMQIQFSDFVVQCVERWKLLFFYLLRCSAAPLFLSACVFWLCFWNYLHFPYTLHIATARCTGTNGARTRECCGRTLNLTLCSNFAVNRKICHARPRHSGAGCASLPPARCRLHPVPHAPRCCCLFPTHVAKVLRMFCSCLFARAEQKVFRRFWRVRKRKCATAAREDDGEWAREGEGNPVCAKNRSILLCESECAFCLRTLDSCRAAPCLAMPCLACCPQIQFKVR